MVRIKKLHVRNFASFEDAEIELQPITALIGVNDAGKTNLLKAFGLLGRLCKHTLETSIKPYGGMSQCTFLGRLQGGLELEVWGDLFIDGGKSAPLPFHYDVTLESFDMRLPPRIAEESLKIGAVQLRRRSDEGLVVKADGSPLQWQMPGNYTFLGVIGNPQNVGAPAQIAPWLQEHPELLLLQRGLSAMQIYRLRPDRLAHPSGSEVDPQLHTDGQNLSAVLEALASNPEHRARMDAIRSALKDAISYITDVGVKAVPGNKEGVVLKTVQFGNRFGETDWFVQASQASDGLLLLLAYLVIIYGPQNAAVLMVEEPENGVHLARLQQLIAWLRDVAKRSNHSVLLTTHSPYLLDALKPSEVCIVTRSGERGSTRLSPMAKFPELEKWRKGFSLGEIWSNLSEEKLSSGG